MPSSAAGMGYWEVHLVRRLTERTWLFASTGYLALAVRTRQTSAVARTLTSWIGAL